MDNDTNQPRLCFHRTISALLTQQQRAGVPLILHHFERTHHFDKFSGNKNQGVKDFLISLSFVGEEVHLLSLKAMTVVTVSFDTCWLSFPNTSPPSGPPIHMTKTEALMFLWQRSRDVVRTISPTPVVWGKPGHHPFIKGSLEKELWRTVCSPEESGITWGDHSPISLLMKGMTHDRSHLITHRAPEAS